MLSSSFRTLYLEWFARLSAQDFDEGDVAAILDAAEAELAGLQARYRGGGITEAGLAYGREQIRDLLERVIRQHAVTATTKRQIRHLITGSFERRLLSCPGRYTQDWFSYHEAHWSGHFGHLAGRSGLNAIEIGSFEGRSACWIVQHLLTGENSRLICVEPFEQYEDQERNFDHNIRVAGCTDKIVKLRGRSQQVLPYLAGESFDFVYVDGSHLVLDVLQDAAMCWPLIRPGGTLVFDDYEHPLFPDSLGMSAGPAIDAFLSMLSGRYELIFADWQVALRKGGPDRMKVIEQDPALAAAGSRLTCVVGCRGTGNNRAVSTAMASSFLNTAGKVGRMAISERIEAGQRERRVLARVCRPRGGWSRPSGNGSGRWPRPAPRGSRSVPWPRRPGCHPPGCTSSWPMPPWTRWPRRLASCGQRAGPPPKILIAGRTPNWTAGTTSPTGYPMR